MKRAPMSCAETADREKTPEMPPAGSPRLRPRKQPRRAQRPGRSRKEVFQPHLPVRLPCYDFRLPWLDGRCVQGPGTYSPRHG